MQDDSSPLDAQDTQTRRRHMSVMQTEVQIFDEILLEINHGTASLTGYRHDRGLNFLCGLLINKAFNSLWRAREDAVSGYPVQSLALCRSALEDWAVLFWVELHPEARDRWLWSILPEVPRPPERPPAYDKIWKEFGDIGAVTHEAYDVLSKFAHPRSVGLRWLIHFDRESTYFHYGPHFDVENLRICLFFLIQTAQAFHERVAQLQVRALGNVDEPWVERCRILATQSQEFIDAVSAEILERLPLNDPDEEAVDALSEAR